MYELVVALDYKYFSLLDLHAILPFSETTGEHHRGPSASQVFGEQSKAECTCPHSTFQLQALYVSAAKASVEQDVAELMLEAQLVGSRTRTMVVGGGGDKVLSFCGMQSDIQDAGVPWISWSLRAPSVVCEATVMP